jgi:hypothetical protein
MAPPGINVMVYEEANDRESWAPHAIPGHYMGPALNSYRCYTVYIPQTRGTRITDTLVWFPEKIPMPGASSNDIIASSLKDIAAALKNPSPKSPICPLDPTHVETLKMLTAAFPEVSSDTDAALPRVVEEKNHRYNTRAATQPPPANKYAYAAKGPIEPGAEAMAGKRKKASDYFVKPTGGGTSSDEAKARMEAAITLSELCDMYLDIPDLDGEEPHLPKGYAMKAVNVDTGVLEEYLNLLQSSEGHLWEESNCEEYYRLCQGNADGSIKGPDTMFFIHKNEVPEGRKVTYSYE